MKTKWQELAWTDEFMGDYKPLNVKENQEELLTELLDRAENCPYDNPSELEDCHKGVYQDNYYMTRDGIDYVIQYDFTCDIATLYQVYNTPQCADCAYLGDKYSFSLPNSLPDLYESNPALKHYYCCCGDCDEYEKDVTPKMIQDCKCFEDIDG